MIRSVASADLERIVDQAAVRRGRDFARVQNRLAHVDRRSRDALARVEPERNGLDSAIGLDRERIFAGNSALPGEPRHASDAVAAHLAAAAVGVVHLHPEVGNARGAKHDDTVAADAEAPVRQAPRERGRIGRTHLIGDYVDVVVAAALHFYEVERRHRAYKSMIFSPRIKSSKVSRSRTTWAWSPSTRTSGARGRVL